ncbi:hypothetical protein CR159_18635 [Pollutimonas subterranea]|uniref:Uncharacterized protein n=1 Tax=Pollutimonas subterranea TaxID=2045210 RepID=A0A2N4TZW7_9BURK|nr:hypothetical protein CR159_18635 [Pollutimonas subterranea]
MDSATFWIIILGSILIAFGLFSLYFSSESAQRRFNPHNETSASPKTRIAVEKAYRTRPNDRSDPQS